MRLKTLGSGALAGGLITSALIALMYLADKLADFAFVPFDLFDWIARLLPGPVITFGIDLLIDTMRGLGLSVANTAKTAEQAMAVGLFLGIGIGVGVVVFAMSSFRMSISERTFGIIVATVFGIPMVIISVATGMSAAGFLPNVVWLSVLFIAWGMALAQASFRLTSIAPGPLPSLEEPLEEPPNVRTVEVIDRRQFLIKIGATTAAITVVGAGLGRLLEVNARRARAQELAEVRARMIDPSKATTLPNAADPMIPAPGTRLEYTSVANPSKVFLRLEPTCRLQYSGSPRSEVAALEL